MTFISDERTLEPMEIALLYSDESSYFYYTEIDTEILNDSEKMAAYTNDWIKQNINAGNLPDGKTLITLASTGNDTEDPLIFLQGYFNVEGKSAYDLIEDETSISEGGTHF